MGRLNSGAPLLDSHDSSSGVAGILGVVESARLADGKGTAIVRFAKGDPAADAAWNKVRQGVLQNVSVGYRIYRAVKTEEVTTDKVPVVRVEDWEPYELSMVAMGADAGAGVRSVSESTNACVFQALPTQGATEMSKPVVTTTTESAEAVASTAPAPSIVEATRAAVAQREARTEATSAAISRATAEALAKERTRVTEIRSMCRGANLDEDLADKMIQDGAGVEEARKAIFEHLTSRSDASAPNSAHFSMGEDQREKFIRGGVAAIIQRYGHGEMIAKAKKVERFANEFRGVSLEAGEFGGMKVLDLARASLERQGVSTRGLHGDALVKRALQYRGDAGMNTTSDFAILLETAVNKIFLGQYAIAPVTWRDWCGTKSVQDFRTSTFYRPGSFSVLDSVSEDGEVKHKNIPDGSKATLTPATKGNIIGISRRSIVNDDLGVFRDTAAQLGDAAAATLEADCFAMLLANSGLGPTQSDSQPLFHANRSNIGATGAMSVTTLDSARAKIKLQKDVSANRFLNLVPRIWLGPIELGGLARQMNDAQFDPSKTTNIPNIVQGLFAKVIDVGQCSAASATRHYLLADPSVAPVFVVGFIDGQEAPRIESDNSFEYDGVQMKVIVDYGTACIDYRGAATSAGA
jgi:hypothetical protein